MLLFGYKPVARIRGSCQRGPYSSRSFPSVPPAYMDMDCGKASFAHKATKIERVPHMDTRSLTLAAIGHSVNILPAEYSRCPVPVSLCWLASGFKHRVVDQDDKSGARADRPSLQSCAVDPTISTSTSLLCHRSADTTATNDVSPGLVKETGLIGLG